MQPPLFVFTWTGTLLALLPTHLVGGQGNRDEYTKFSYKCSDVFCRVRLFTKRGYGEERAIASNDTAEGRQENRRVEVTVPKAGKSVAAQ